MRHVALLVGVSLFASPAGRVITFDTFPLGATPPGWTVAMTNGRTPPHWEVRQDQSAPTQPYVLAQTSKDPTDDRFPLVILDGVTMRDGEVSVRLKPVSGREDQGGGLVWRYRDPQNYYLARANAMNKTVTVFRVQNGRRTALPSVKHEIPLNEWSILKVAARGNRFQVYVDHRRVIDGQDAALTGAGKVGLCTIADSVMYFDDFRVYPR